jgi:hypothetical protein
VAQLTPAREPLSAAPPATRCTTLALWGCAGVVLVAVTLGWVFARAVPSARETEPGGVKTSAPAPASAPAAATSAPAPAVRPVAEPPVSPLAPPDVASAPGGSPPAIPAETPAVDESAPAPDPPPAPAPAHPEAHPRRKVPALKQIRIED